MEDFNFYLHLFTDCYFGQYKKSINKNNEITVGKRIFRMSILKNILSPIYIMLGNKFLRDLMKICYPDDLKLVWKNTVILSVFKHNIALTLSGNELKGLLVHSDSQFLQRVC